MYSYSENLAKARESAYSGDNSYRKVEVTLNSQLTFVLNVYELADFIAVMQGKSVKTGYGASAEIVPVEFSLNYQNIVSEDPKTDREKALEEERDQRNRWWSDELAKVRKLEAELKVLKGEG